MPYRLIASDLDGTLFGPDLTVSPRVKAALRQAAARGVRLCVATGRMVRATRPFVADLPVAAPLICYQGAVIADPATGEFLWHRPLPRSLADEALPWLAELGLHVNLYLDDRLLLERITPEAEAYMRLSRVDAEVVRFADTPGDPTKLVAIGPREVVREALAQLSDRFAGRANVATSLPEFLELTHPEASKGLALAEVCRQLGVSPTEVVAFGDGLNDATLLSAAGLGVAMAGGSAELAARADRVAPSMAEDGVARVLEDLLGLGTPA